MSIAVRVQLELWTLTVSESPGLSLIVLTVAIALLGPSGPRHGPLSKKCTFWISPNPKLLKDPEKQLLRQYFALLLTWLLLCHEFHTVLQLQIHPKRLYPHQHQKPARVNRLPNATGIGRTGFWIIADPFKGLKGPFPLPLKSSVALKAQSSVVFAAKVAFLTKPLGA